MVRLALFIFYSVLVVTAVAATCVTQTSQRGPQGPFVAEIANIGDQTVHGAGAVSRVYDAEGREVLAGNVGGLACPSKLNPGERGVIEVFPYDDQWIPTAPRDEWHLPLRAEFFRIEQPPEGTGQARSEGLWVEEIARNPLTATVNVRVHNNASEHYQQFRVCAVLRSFDGEALEVARADSPHLPYTLFPGEALDMELRFNSFPPGYLTYHALGLFGGPYLPCCPVNGPSDWHPVDVGPFSVLLPPGWRYEPGQGIDSFVGAFVGEGVNVGFDYGIYSNSLPFEGDPTKAVHRETIGGYTAKVVRSLVDGRGTTGVAFDDLGPSGLGAFPLNLTLAAHELTVWQQFTVLQILRSVRFDVRPYPSP